MRYSPSTVLTRVMSRTNRLTTANWHKKNVDCPNLINLLGCELMAEITKMAENNIIKVDDIHGIASQIGTLLLIVECPHTTN